MKSVSIRIVAFSLTLMGEIVYYFNRKLVEILERYEILRQALTALLSAEQGMRI